MESGGLAAVVLSRVCPEGRDEGAPLTGSGRPPDNFAPGRGGSAQHDTLGLSASGASQCPRPASAWRGAECSVTAGHHRPGGIGDSGPASARRARQRPHARGRGLSRRPRTPDRPLTFPADAIGLVVLPLSVHAFALGQLALFMIAWRALAGHWRAEGAPLKP
jgi:hypothetical protein